MKVNKSDVIYDRLDNLFADAKCELNFSNNFELLVAVMLSAQCTDKRVNQVTNELFKKYKTPDDFANANIEILEQEIFSCGFYHNKAKNIIAMSKDLIQKHNREVPCEFEDLIKLAGVGRKTANVVLAVGFNQDAIAVDTHVFRVSNRLGLVKTKNVLKCELELQKKVSKDKWSVFHHQLVLFGRYYCKAIKPQCNGCVLKDLCESYRGK